MKETQKVKQAADWLMSSLKPFTLSAVQQHRIFSDHRSDVIELLNQIEDTLGWQLETLAAAKLIDSEFRETMDSLLEEIYRLGLRNEVPTVEVLSGADWATLRRGVSHILEQLEASALSFESAEGS